MNIPKRMSVNTRFACGNRHSEKTKPFIDPSMLEMSAAGIVIARVRSSAGASVFQARVQLSNPVGPPSVADSQGQRMGRFQLVAGFTSDGALRLVMMSTYTGVSTMITNATSSTYLVVREITRVRRTAPDAGRMAVLIVLHAPCGCCS